MSLLEIQQKLKAPKNQFNKFGGYNYRNCEDIFEAVKPLLGDCLLTVSDELVMIGDRYYVKATATLQDGDKVHSVSAYARESVDKKGMDDAQITGACSSYARKYALNGLLLIDDNKDPDSPEHGSKEGKKGAGKADPLGVPPKSAPPADPDFPPEFGSLDPAPGDGKPDPGVAASIPTINKIKIAAKRAGLDPTAEGEKAANLTEWQAGERLAELQKLGEQ